jgi:hypothetical protein
MASYARYSSGEIVHGRRSRQKFQRFFFKRAKNRMIDAHMH